MFNTCSLHYEQFQDGAVICIQDEIPFEAPLGWSWCRLKDLFNVCSAKRVLQAEWRKEGVPFYRAREIVKLSNTGYVDNDLFISEEHYYNLKQSYGVPQAGDLMITGVGTIGKVYIVQENDIFYYKDASVLCFENRYRAILSEYARIMIDSPLLQTQIHSKTYGNTVDTITISTANEYICLLPPIKEQERIIDAVERATELISRIEIDKKDLSVIVSQTKSKILDLAIRGKLVPQNPNDEPASVLLERIRAEKEELIKQGKIKRDKKESVIFKGDDNSYYRKTGSLIEDLTEWNLNEIPSNWIVCCLGDICDYGNCENIAVDNIPNDSWILELEDIEKDSGKVLQKVKKYERMPSSVKHAFTNGQVLYSKLRPYLNKVLIANDDGFCTSEIIPLKILGAINHKYVLYFLKSPSFLNYTNKCSYGVKMPRLGTEDGKKSVFILPPFAEQDRIVKAIETAFSYLDNIANSIS